MVLNAIGLACGSGGCGTSANDKKRTKAGRSRALVGAATRLLALDLIGWSLERDSPLHKGGGFYHRSVKPAIDRDGDTLDVLAKQVGIRGMFSDWPATTTCYASCDEVRRMSGRRKEKWRFTL